MINPTKLRLNVKGPVKEASVSVYQKGELKLDHFLKGAKGEIDTFGISLEETIRDYLETLKEILDLKDIKSVRILLCNPNSPIKDQIIRQVDTNVGTIQSSIDTFNELTRTLSNDVVNKLQFRRYNEISVQSIFILDRNADTGVIRFSPYIFGIQKELRRIFEICKSSKKQRKIFELYCNSYDELWLKSHDVTRT
jgi:hypothetical protein